MFAFAPSDFVYRVTTDCQHATNREYTPHDFGKLWNNLPTNIRDLVTPVPIIQSSDDLLSQDETLILLDPLKRFKCQLKTTLFNTAYN